MSTPKAKRQPLSDNRKLLIIIIAICLAAIIAVSITLGVLLKEPERTPDDNNANTTPSSNLPVKNGDFALVNSDDTAFPKSALNWTKYGYKSADEFETIDTTANVVMGIVDTADWDNVVADVKDTENVELGANPNQHKLGDNEKHDNSNVYMIAAKNATSAVIMSDSVTVSATTSVKITVWLNTKYLTSGKATIMIQNSSSTPNPKEDNRYAYNYDIGKADGDENGWSSYEFFVFNRKTSTQYVRVSVGLGNNYVSTDNTAEGVLFIDDITYETVTANDYRIKADEANEGDTTYKIIEKEEETTVAQESKYLALNDLDGVEQDITFTTSKAYVDANKYSPFTTKDDFTKKDGEETVATGFGIYKLENDGSNQNPLGLQISEPLEITLAEDDDTKQDYQHVSFWVRTKALENNALAFANIVVERSDDYDKNNASAATWKALDSGDFTFKTEQNIETDTNNGWTKYDIYLKPAENTTFIRITFALGSVKGYEGTDYAPQGELYVTTPYFETISSSAYSSASSGTATKKFDLTGNTADTTVSNGSFSVISTNTNQPANWTPVFAGQNAIYKDGQKNVDIKGLSTDTSAIEGSGVIRWKDEGINDGYQKTDDDEGRVLKLVSNAKSSYGYISNEISLSSQSVYVFSVMAKVMRDTNALPYFYLLETNVDRDKAIIGKVENTYASTTVDGSWFCQSDEVYKDTGWVRYYIVYVTGDDAISVRLALFNGSIDGNVDKAADEGSTVYYDKVSMQTLGSYSLVEDEDNKEATEYKVTFTAASGFKAFENCENVAEVKTKLESASSTIAFTQPDEAAWNEMKKIPEPTDDDKTDDATDDTKTPRDVNLGLLFSILSSVILLAALAVVVVIKLFKRRKSA